MAAPAASGARFSFLGGIGPRMSRFWLPIALCLTLSACIQKSADDSSPRTSGQVAAREDDSGALGGAVVEKIPAKTETVRKAKASPRETDWAPMELTSGDASISCESDYAEKGDGEALVSLGFSSVRNALSACRERGLVRLRYQGKISAEFTALVERVAEVAGNLEIGKRILDLDSSGGLIEDAIRAGDAIAESDWTIWVREGAICHSACVLVLAAGDMRLIAGKVGIHRMVRVGSAATSRAELSRELREVHAQIKDYLERNGAAAAVADLMMTVPNRSLRILAEAELKEYGLEGTNAAEDDLERIVLARKCGEAFVRRKDDFARAFDSECAATGQGVDAMNACGLSLRQRFHFPDRRCPAESPLSEHDSADGRPTG
jgi:membrane-bound ClpP family serine protease